MATLAKNEASKSHSSARPLALITGASSGIGFELAKLFAKDGYDLLLVGQSGKIRQCASELAPFNVRVEALQLDLAQPESIDQVAYAAKNFGSPLAAVALNAGVGVGGDFARETALEAELNMIAVNVTSVVHLAKHISKEMVDRGEGKMLFTASMAGVMPGPLYAVYAASKAFVLSFAEALRNELKDTGVSVTALMPGPTDTNFFVRAGMENTVAGQGKKDSAADVAKDGYDALMAGKDHVVAGSSMNQMQYVAARVMTEPAKAAMHRKFTEEAPSKS